jgi:hypothetical protein
MRGTNHNELNKQVHFNISTLPHPEAGNGLFASEDIIKRSIFCTYGGSLVDAAEAKYLNPVYIVSFELGRGSKLVGDGADGDMGHYANSVHPDCSMPKQNARFVMASKKTSSCGTRGWFSLQATEDIKRGDEIFVNYGDGYWSTMKNWKANPTALVKPLDVKKRDARALKRSVAKLLVASQNVGDVL